MQARANFLIVLAVAGFINEAAAECDKLPDDFNMDGCCNVPKTGIEELILKIADKFKDQKLEEHLKECKIFEALFMDLKWIKDNGIDKDAIWKFLDPQIKDANWRNVMKNAVDQCAKDIDEFKDKIVKQLADPPFSISKDQCNVIFMSMATCSQLESFANCPKDSWTEEKRCTQAKTWINKCGDKIDSMVQFDKKKAH